MCIIVVMKKIALAGATLGLAAACAWAGPETIIKQRAKELRDQNNVRQGVPPATAPPPAPAPKAAPVAPTPSQQNMSRLQMELAAVKPTAPATPEQKQRLSRLLLAMAEGPAKPSAAAADKLVELLAEAQASNPLPAASRARLVQDLDGIINPSKYPQARREAILADVQAIFQAGGLPRSRAVAIAEATRALGGPGQ